MGRWCATIFRPYRCCNGRWLCAETINGWDEAIDPSTGEVLSGKVREAQTIEKEFWDPIFNKTDFKEFVKKQYTIGHRDMVAMDEIVDES